LTGDGALKEKLNPLPEDADADAGAELNGLDGVAGTEPKELDGGVGAAPNEFVGAAEDPKEKPEDPEVLPKVFVVPLLAVPFA